MIVQDSAEERGIVYFIARYSLKRSCGYKYVFTRYDAFHQTFLTVSDDVVRAFSLRVLYFRGRLARHIAPNLFITI